MQETWQQYLADCAGQIESVLDRLLPQPDNQLYSAMRYSIMGGGKRLRPALFMATLDACGMDNKSSLLPFAAALEMIHTYSLIHDDLPAMDNDDYRRGQTSCHKAYDEAVAILAGDALLNEAFCQMLAIKTNQELPSVNLLAAVKEVADNAGIKGMIGGQAADIDAAGQKVSLEHLSSIYLGKTAALFRASIISAAILAKADQQQILALYAYANQLGLAFQIADDILDVSGDRQLTGKPVGSDAKNAQSTYVSLLGLEAAQQAAKATAQKAVSELNVFGKEADMLRSAAKCLAERNC